MRTLHFFARFCKSLRGASFKEGFYLNQRKPLRDLRKPCKQKNKDLVSLLEVLLSKKVSTLTRETLCLKKNLLETYENLASFFVRKVFVSL